MIIRRKGRMYVSSTHMIVFAGTAPPLDYFKKQNMSRVSTFCLGKTKWKTFVEFSLENRTLEDLIKMCFDSISSDKCAFSFRNFK